MNNSTRATAPERQRRTTWLMVAVVAAALSLGLLYEFRERSVALPQTDQRDPESPQPSGIHLRDPASARSLVSNTDSNATNTPSASSAPIAAGKARIIFRAVRANDGAPLPEFVVEAIRLSPPRSAVDCERTRSEAGDCILELDCATATTFRMILRAPGYVARNIVLRELAPTTSRDLGNIDMVQGVELAVTVTGYGERYLMARWSASNGFDGVSREVGARGDSTTYDFGIVQPGIWDLTSRQTGWTFDPPSISIEATPGSQRHAVAATRTPSSTISGTVRTRQGPVEDATVELAGTLLSTRTNKQGQFSLSHAASDQRVRLRVVKHDLIEAQFGPFEPRIESLDLVVERAARLRVRLNDTLGKPREIGGAIIYPLNGRFEASKKRERNGDGRGSFVGLSPGLNLVRVHPSDTRLWCPPRAVSLEPGTEEVSIELMAYPWSECQLRVVDRDDNPVRGATIRLLTSLQGSPIDLSNPMGNIGSWSNLGAVQNGCNVFEVDRVLSDEAGIGRLKLPTATAQFALLVECGEGRRLLPGSTDTTTPIRISD